MQEQRYLLEGIPIAIQSNWGELWLAKRWCPEKKNNEEEKCDMQEQEKLVASIPASIRQVAEKERLGEVVAVVDKHQNPREAAMLISCGGIIAIVLIAMITSVLATVSFIAYLILIIALFLILIIFVFARYQAATEQKEDQMVIYDYGLAALENGEAKTLRWEKINAVFRGTIISPQRQGMPYLSDIDTMRIYGLNKEVYRIDDNLPKHLRAKICDTVEHGLIECRLMWMENVYVQGGVLVFGTLKLSKWGWNDGQEVLPWNNVEYIEVGPARVIIRQSGRTSDWYNKWLPEVENACLLREIVAQLDRPDGQLKRG